MTMRALLLATAVLVATIIADTVVAAPTPPAQRSAGILYEVWHAKAAEL